MTRTVDLTVETFGAISHKTCTVSEEELSVLELEDLFKRRKYARDTTRWVDIIVGEDSDKLIAALVEELRPVLAPFLDPDSDAVGHGLCWIRAMPWAHSGTIASGLLACEGQTTVSEFAKTLAVAGACLGSEHACGRVRAWAQGDALQYRSCTLLINANVSMELESGGVRIACLPGSMSELPSHLPTGGSWPVEKFLHGAVISIETSAAPVLFRLEASSGLQRNVRPQCVLCEGERLIDEFCEALSLAANARVHRKGMWMDYGDLTSFGFTESGLSAGPFEVAATGWKIQLD